MTAVLRLHVVTLTPPIREASGKQELEETRGSDPIH